MPKRKRQPPAAARPAARRAGGRHGAEPRNQVLLVSVVAVVLIALGVVGFGYYQTEIAPKGDPVLRVEDRSFSLGYFERRARYEVRPQSEGGAGNSSVLRNPLTGAPLDAETAANYLVDMVRDEELVRRGAAEEGIEITDDDIDAEIRKRANLPPDADRDAFAAAYRRAVRGSGLSTSDYRELIAAGVLENRLRQKFQSDMPETAEQIRYRLIQVATLEEAEAVLERLNGGEDFAALAAELSTDLASKDEGGEKPWAAQGTLEPSLDDVIFDLEVGELSEIIQTRLGFVVVEVLERQADRELTLEHRIELSNKEFDDWLQALRERTRILVFLDDDKTLSIVEALAG